VNEDKTISAAYRTTASISWVQLRRCYSTRRTTLLGTRPSKKSIKHILEAVHMHTARSMELLDATSGATAKLALSGWAITSIGPGHEAYDLSMRTPRGGCADGSVASISIPARRTRYPTSTCIKHWTYPAADVATALPWRRHEVCREPSARNTPARSMSGK